jgi:glycosyltransferase involved in cell wall biosynthesis
MSQPLVSVIIPTYNRAKEVRASIESVLSQTYPALEVVVVDDGSTDGTAASLGEYGDRITLVTQENQGPSAARNHGIEVSRGEIIAFLDSDDLWLPTKLERQVALMIACGPKVPCCLVNTTMNFSDGSVRTSFDVARLRTRYDEGVWLNPADVLAHRFVLFTQAAAVWREAWDRVGGFRPELRLMEDLEVGFRLARLGPWCFVSEPLAIWHGGSPNSLYAHAGRAPLETRRLAASLYANLLAQPDLTPRIRRVLERRRRIAERAGSTGSGHLLSSIAARIDSLLYHRSPTIPRMRSQSLPAFLATRTDHGSDVGSPA